MIGLQIRSVMQVQPAHLPLAGRVRLHVQPVDSGAEAIFAAKLLDRSAHALDHGDQAEGADVRMRFGQDLGRRTGLHELGQYLAVEVPGILDPAVQLSIGKGAGAALAELYV